MRKILMWSFFSTETTVTVLRSCRFSWLRSSRGARTLRSVRASAAKAIPGALPWHQSFGNRLAAGLIRLLYGVKISDLGPFRAGRADVLRALALEEATYGWAVEMIVKGAIAGFRIVEVPVSYHPRIGKSKISGTVKGTIGAAWFILSRIALYSFRRRRAGTPRPA